MAAAKQEAAFEGGVVEIERRAKSGKVSLRYAVTQQYLARMQHEYLEGLNLTISHQDFDSMLSDSIHDGSAMRAIGLLNEALERGDAFRLFGYEGKVHLEITGPENTFAHVGLREIPERKGMVYG